jgi:hypothetical protein
MEMIDPRLKIEQRLLFAVRLNAGLNANILLM